MTYSKRHYELLANGGPDTADQVAERKLRAELLKTARKHFQPRIDAALAALDVEEGVRICNEIDAWVQEQMRTHQRSES